MFEDNLPLGDRIDFLPNTVIPWRNKRNPSYWPYAFPNFPALKLVDCNWTKESDFFWHCPFARYVGDDGLQVKKGILALKDAYSKHASHFADGYYSLDLSVSLDKFPKEVVEEILGCAEVIVIEAPDDFLFKCYDKQHRTLTHEHSKRHLSNLTLLIEVYNSLMGFCGMIHDIVDVWNQLLSIPEVVKEHSALPPLMKLFLESFYKKKSTLGESTLYKIAYLRVQRLAAQLFIGMFGDDVIRKGFHQDMAFLPYDTSSAVLFRDFVCKMVWMKQLVLISPSRIKSMPDTSQTRYYKKQQARIKAIPPLLPCEDEDIELPEAQATTAAEEPPAALTVAPPTRKRRKAMSSTQRGRAFVQRRREVDNSGYRNSQALRKRTQREASRKEDPAAYKKKQREEKASQRERARKKNK